MMMASELLEAYAGEEIHHSTRMVCQTTTGLRPIKIVSSDISDIDLKLTKEEKTMTFKDVLDLFMADMIVGSTEFGLIIDEDITADLELMSMTEEVIILQTI